MPLDEILDNATDLPIPEHATDSHGVTLVNFSLFDVVGKILSPAHPQPAAAVLHTGMGRRWEYLSRYPHAGPALTELVTQNLIAEQWDDMLRLAGWLKYGYADASVRAQRTIHACRYLSDDTYRYRLAAGSTRGESLHELRRDPHFASLGKITKRHLEQQTGCWG